MAGSHLEVPGMFPDADTTHGSGDTKACYIDDPWSPWRSTRPQIMPQTVPVYPIAPPLVDPMRHPERQIVTTLPAKTPHRCPVCTGVGTRKRAKWEAGSGPVQCQACDGKGLVWG